MESKLWMRRRPGWKPATAASVKACFEYFESHYVVAVTTAIQEFQQENKDGVEEVKEGGKEAARERLESRRQRSDSERSRWRCD